MENALDKIEQIMSPIYEKQQEQSMLENARRDEVEKLVSDARVEYDRRNQQIENLNRQLDRLRNNKENEIREYAEFLHESYPLATVEGLANMQEEN